MQANFPRQDVSEIEKNKNNKQWYKDAIDYAIRRHFSDRQRRLIRIRRMYNGYNGIINEADFAQYNKTYGKANMVKYIDYRLCRTKIDHIIGEQLESPINGTVYTTNPDAHVRRLEAAEAIIGLHHAASKIKDLREKVGVNVFDGMQPPQVPEGKTIFETLSPKSKNERNMQLILDRQIDDMGMKMHFSENMGDLTLTSECFGKAYIDDDGNVKYRTVPPELFMSEESERDPFLEKSPYRGECRKLFEHDVLKEFRLNKADADKLRSISKGEASTDGFTEHYETINGALAFLVYTIEWMGCECSYIKKYTDKQGNPGEAEISSDYYERNKKKIDYEIEQGKYTLDVKYKFVLYEATRIGHEIYVNLEKSKNIPFSNENPSWTDYHYIGMLFNTKGGVRVSIKQLTEHIDRMYNMVMWQINRELAKSKGKVLFYDLALLPKGKELKDVMHNMTNDQIVPYNSAEDGNNYGKDGANAVGMKEADMGVSNSVNILIPLKMNLEAMADRITGIAQGRMGNIPASSTVENAKENIENSLTTTAPLFYYFSKFQEKVLRRVLDLSKISYGILKPEKGEMILGIDGMQSMVQTQDIPFDDYGFSLGDAKKEQAIRSMLRANMAVAINANPELIEVSIDSEIASTVTEAQAIIKKAMKDLRDMRAQEAQADRDAQAANAQAQIQGQQQNVQMQGDQAIREIGAKGVAKSAEIAQAGTNQQMLQNSMVKK